MFNYKFKPSKTAKREFAQKMNEIDEFCKENLISNSKTNDSYYFSINGQKYRVSNHAVESRNKYDEITGELKNARGYELDSTRDDDTVYIHASKTRIIEIYNNLKSGKRLNGRGF
jgi:uncharacterized coiled-coil DUF342 family protein